MLNPSPPTTISHHVPSCKVNTTIMSNFKWLIHVLIGQFLCICLILWINVYQSKNVWYLVWHISWNKKVLTHSELEITWAEDISLENEIKNKDHYQCFQIIHYVKSQWKTTLIIFAKIFSAHDWKTFVIFYATFFKKITKKNHLMIIT